MSNRSSYQKTDDHEDTVDHVGIAEYEVMAAVVAEFLRAHDDVRISLARHRNRGGWFLLVTSASGVGQAHDDLPKTATTDDMRAAIERLHGRLGMADAAAARDFTKKTKQHTESKYEDWEDW